MVYKYKAMKNKFLGSHQKKRKNGKGEHFFFFLKLKNKCLSSHQKQFRNDDGKPKYHIIRKIHAFHVFPKIDYLARSLALSFWGGKLDEGTDENQNFIFLQPK